MKRFLILFSFLITICLSAHSQASGLADLKFGQYQIADSQWNVSACMYTATCQIYSKNPGTAYKIPWTSGQLSWASGDYVAFVATGNGTNPWNAVQYSSNGTQKAVMGTGHIINMGNDYFFFVGNDNNTGQLFSMTQGFANTSGVTWTGTLNPTVAQVNTYASNGSTTPLAAGQKAAPATPPPRAAFTTNSNMNVAGSGSAYAFIYQGNSGDWSVVTGIKAGDYWRCDNCDGPNKYGRVASVQQPSSDFFYLYLTDMNGNAISPESGKWYTYSDTTLVPVLCCGGSSAAFNANGTKVGLVQTFTNRTSADSQVFIEQIGNQNTITINQKGSRNNYASYHGNGSNNNISIAQTGTQSTIANYADLTVTGNNNSVNLQQTSTAGAKAIFASVQDNNNSLLIQQKDGGNHWANVSLSGGSKNVDILQQGSAGHMAKIGLTGLPVDLSLSQTGSTQQFYSIQFNCATTGGCPKITVQQGQ
jgi:hypothetical protein